MYSISVLTPTYNREKELFSLYRILLNQSNLNFQWIIVDDGSTDNTRQVVKDMMSEDKINIKYHYQQNGGKGRALNKGFKLVHESTLFVIVDSDDTLLPDAIETIDLYLNKYGNDPNIGAFFFRYKFPTNTIIANGKLITSDEILTRYEYNNKYGKNDGCICYFSKVTKKYHYPEYKNENYIGPTVLQMQMSKEFKIVFSPEVIGVADYQNDGLTKSGRKLRLKNPKGMIHYALLQMSKENKATIRLKYAISIWPYLQKEDVKYSDSLKLFPNKILGLITLVPGYFLSLYWKSF